MRVGLAVQEFFTCDVKRNILQIEASAVEAAAAGCDLVFFGEAVLQGFLAFDGDYEHDRAIAVSQDSADIAAIRKITKKHKIAIGFGYLEADGDGLYSSFIVLGADGATVHNFRRVSIGWKEPHWGAAYREGDNFGCFTLNGVIFHIGLCGDFWSEESRLDGSFLNVLWPVYCDFDSFADEVYTDYAKRAAKIGKNILLVNSILNENDNHAEGIAAVYHDGVVAQSLPRGEAGVLVRELT